MEYIGGALVYIILLKMSITINAIDVNNHTISYTNSENIKVTKKVNELNKIDSTINYEELLKLRKTSEEAYAHIVNRCQCTKLYARREYIKFEVLVKDLPSLVALVGDNSDLYDIKYLEHGMPITEHFPIEYADGEFINTVSCSGNIPHITANTKATVVILSKDWTRRCNKFIELLSKWDVIDDSECLKVLQSLNDGKLYTPEIPKQSIHLGLMYNENTSISCQKLRKFYNIECEMFYRRHVRINNHAYTSPQLSYSSNLDLNFELDISIPNANYGYIDVDRSVRNSHIKAYRSIIMVKLEHYRVESLSWMVNLYEGLKMETSYNKVQCSIDTRIRNTEYYNEYGEDYPNRIVCVMVWAEDWLYDIDLSEVILHWAENE
jgi:hypothetical protein